MSVATEVTIAGFGHCPDARCPGYAQSPAELVRTTVETTFLENGGAGSVPGVETSHEYLRFAHTDDGTCGECGKQREAALEERVVYNNLSGKDPMGLLGGLRFDPSKVISPNAELEATVAEQGKQIAALLEALNGPDEQSQPGGDD